MAKRVLFLDDDPGRHKAVKHIFLHDEAYTAQDAIQKLQDALYDVVFLDHDLGGMEMVESNGSEETGYTVAKWIAANKPTIPLIVVHSLNPVGSENIASLLRQSGYNVYKCMFTFLRAFGQDFLDWDPSTPLSGVISG